MYICAIANLVRLGWLWQWFQEYRRQELHLYMSYIFIHVYILYVCNIYYILYIHIWYILDEWMKKVRNSSNLSSLSLFICCQTWLWGEGEANRCLHLECQCGHQQTLEPSLLGKSSLNNQPMNTTLYFWPHKTAIKEQLLVKKYNNWKM